MRYAKACAHFLRQTARKARNSGRPCVSADIVTAWNGEKRKRAAARAMAESAIREPHRRRARGRGSACLRPICAGMPPACRDRPHAAIKQQSAHDLACACVINAAMPRGRSSRVILIILFSRASPETRPSTPPRNNAHAQLTARNDAARTRAARCSASAHGARCAIRAKMRVRVTMPVDRHFCRSVSDIAYRHTPRRLRR